jgi:hypothetical protein
MHSSDSTPSSRPGQRYNERRAAGRMVLGGNRAAVRFNDLFRDAQAKTPFSWIVIGLRERTVRTSSAYQDREFQDRRQ